MNRQSDLCWQITATRLRGVAAILNCRQNFEAGSNNYKFDEYWSAGGTSVDG
jgi:hypothetical protein